MKQLTSLLMILVIAGSLVSCGGGESPEKATQAPAASSEKMTQAPAASSEKMTITDPIRMELVRVPAGEFLMGSVLAAGFFGHSSGCFG